MTPPAPLPPAPGRARRALAGALVVVALAASSCADGGSTTTPATDSTAPEVLGTVETRPVPTTTAPPTTIAPTTSAAPTTAIPTTPLDPAELQAMVDAYVADSGLPGAVLAVGRPGADPVAVTSGTADLATGESLTPDARFRLASLTKPATATVVLQLAAEGALDLDDPVVATLPELADTGFPDIEAVTPRMLLNHTSGLTDYALNGFFIAAALLGGDRPWSADDILAFVWDEPPVAPPGERFAYGSSSYLVLGQLIEAVTGRPADEVLAERVLDPLGLAATELRPAATPPPEVVAHYYTGFGFVDLDLTTLPPAPQDSYGWTAGGLVGTAADARRLAEGVFSGEVLDADSLAAMLEPTLDRGYGLGVELDVVAGRELRWHEGLMPGFHTTMGWFPDTGVSFALLANGMDGDVTSVIEALAGL